MSVAQRAEGLEPPTLSRFRLVTGCGVPNRVQNQPDMAQEFDSGVEVIMSLTRDRRPRRVMRSGKSVSSRLARILYELRARLTEYGRFLPIMCFATLEV